MMECIIHSTTLQHLKNALLARKQSLSGRPGLKIVVVPPHSLYSAICLAAMCGTKFHSAQEPFMPFFKPDSRFLKRLEFSSMCPWWDT